MSCFMSVRANDVARAPTTWDVRARLQGDDQEGEETKVSCQRKQKYLPRPKIFCTTMKIEHATLSIQIKVRIFDLQLWVQVPQCQTKQSAFFKNDGLTREKLMVICTCRMCFFLCSKMTLILCLTEHTVTKCSIF